MEIFNEEKLRQEIINTWGKAGVHIEIFNMMQSQIETLKIENKELQQKLSDNGDSSLDWLELRNKLKQTEAINTELLKGIENLKKEAEDLMDFCIDRKYLDLEDETDGQVSFNKAILKAKSLLSKHPYINSNCTVASFCMAQYNYCSQVHLKCDKCLLKNSESVNKEAVENKIIDYKNTFNCQLLRRYGCNMKGDKNKTNSGNSMTD